MEPSGLGGIPALAACGGIYEQECDDPQDGDREDYPDYSEQEPPDEVIEEQRFIYQRDKWADEYLAAEKAVAKWWRWPLVEISDGSGQRMGTLFQHPRVTPTPNGPHNEYVEYVCDPNYDHAQSGGCVPADRDYDCWELRSWGIANIGVIGEDWMLLDEDFDGVGCEVGPQPE
jgi:hypothetical protein